MNNNSKSLYLSSEEHDSCGIGLIADLKKQKSHSVIFDALKMLENMEHRGATGSDKLTGDGSGILIQIDHDFYFNQLKKQDIQLPKFGEYGIGMVFLPADEKEYNKCKEYLNQQIEKLGFNLLAYREVPKTNQYIGVTAKSAEPKIEQVFVECKDEIEPDALERKLFVLRNLVSHNLKEYSDFYIASFSYKVITYKGQFTTDQLRTYYLDLQDENLGSNLALVHSRFSTNTFPKWKLAQPFRYIAHNGEINTIRGNVNFSKSSEKLFESTLFTKEELEMLTPICDLDNSDSSNLDNWVEMLVLGGRSVEHVMMMLIPEAWQGDPMMEKKKKDFYRYHASISEPWDGPASVCFTDGKTVGATLDRNGLRPSRYYITKDNKLILASEAGALVVPEENIEKKGRLEPGKILLADLEKGVLISDKEVKDKLASRKPYGEWLELNNLNISDLPEPKKEPKPYVHNEAKFVNIQHAYGFSRDDLRFIIAPMATEGKEPIGSMGADIPLAVLSHQSQHISTYFKQQFAQVSNPPIDPIRERPIMSLRTFIGRTFNMLQETPGHCEQIIIRHPVISNNDLRKLKQINHSNFRSETLEATFKADGKEGRLEKALDRLCKEAEEAIINNGTNILIISDKNISKQYAPIPSLLSLGAIHQHLVKTKLRVRTSLIVEAGDIKGVHSFATLMGYGATGVNPYLTIETIKELLESGAIPEDIPLEEAFENYKKAVAGGLLKTASKMGISTMQSYQGAQIFEAIGLNSAVMEKCFKGTVSQLEGINFDGLAKEVLARHKHAFPETTSFRKVLPVGGKYQWKKRGELHLFNPETIHKLQQSTRLNDYKLYKEYSHLVDDQTDKPITLRGLFDFNKKRSPIDIKDVESKEDIFKRFVTGAMSFGSISHEAHSTLAIAMNRIGGKSNSGEGGEDEIRFQPDENGDSQMSAIKQVASGRFGVTINYLNHAKEIQIKMAQGAKPGEGGHLPGHKVDDWIGRVRNSTPGVGLISPPPHHDIYSIEDLKQLIFDLKNANPDAKVSVKLVAKAGVGTIAAGVAKAFADTIIIAGHDGGTGASPLSSIQNAGTPWELGLSEAHQTLVKNQLRSRVRLQTDGQIRTGRDLAIATLLGAEEWGVATAALVVEGCVMMRKCHKNTCPVGIATQNKRLRQKFNGKVDWVVNYFTFLAEELREIMAELGFRTINEMVGQVDMLKVADNISHWKPQSLDLSPILYKSDIETGLYKQIDQESQVDGVLDCQLIEKAKNALEKQEKVCAEFPIINTDRAAGTMLSSQIAKKYKSEGLPNGTINYKFNGSAGQSFGAFGAKGLAMELEGEANDYFGKGLSGAELVVYPSKEATYKAEENTIIGNVAFYGATSGEAFISGIAGERFAVRNSGAKVVVEGVGAHACEYMTGGMVIILGEFGRNFGAGMSGGIAYVYDKDNNFKNSVCDGFKDIESISYDDEELIRSYVEKHLKKTKSKLAERLLANWDSEVDKFVKAFPIEYKNALKNKQ
jgi:glutamate synthase (NADPH/NADH) large chain